MSLLENELTLSCVDVRKGRYDDALNRLMETERIFGKNVLVQNNLAVVKCVQEGSNLNGQNQHTQEILTSFQQIIISNPLNYIGYYNLFNFHVKNANYPQALRSLIQSISALYLSKAFNLKQQRILKLVPKQCCADCVIFHIVKAIIYIKNQKYIIAISELNWVVENSLLIVKDKITILQFIKLIFMALQEKEKQQETELKIQELENSSIKSEQKSTDSDDSFRIKCTLLIPEAQTDITTQLSKRLKQFAFLLKDTQIGKMKKSFKTNEYIFKQVSASQLKQLPTNKQILFEALQSSILQSPLYTKSESKKLSRSRHSEQQSINTSQQLILNPVNRENFILTSHRSQFAQRQNLGLSLSPSSDLICTLQSTRDDRETKRMSSSLNISSFAGGKKSQNFIQMKQHK